MPNKNLLKKAQKNLKGGAERKKSNLLNLKKNFKIEAVKNPQKFPFPFKDPQRGNYGGKKKKEGVFPPGVSPRGAKKPQIKNFFFLAKIPLFYNQRWKN